MQTADYMKKAPPRFAAYLRVSSEEQKDKETIKNQRQALEKWSRERGQVEIVAWYDQDDGVSGDVPFAEREGGAQLLADAAAGKFDGVCVYSFSRLARRTEDTLWVLRRVHEEMGLSLRSASEDITVDGMFGKVIVTIFAVIAELEKSQILERTRLGTLRIAREGQWPGGKVRYGYLRVTREMADQDHTLQVGRLTPHPEHAAVVQRIFQLVLDGWSTYRIALLLTAERVPPPMAGKRPTRGHRSAWSSSTISQLLHETAYIGMYVYRVRAVIRRDGRRVGIKKRLATDHILIPTPVLVTLGDFEQASEILTDNKKRSTGNTQQVYSLKGKVECGICGHGYVGHNRKLRSKFKRYYGCWNRHWAKQRPCHCPRIQADVLEADVREAIRGFVRNPGPALEQAAGHLGRPAATESGAVAGLLAKLEENLTELRERRQELGELVSERFMTKERAREKRNEFDNQEAVLLEEREKLAHLVGPPVDVPAELGDLATMLGELAEEVELLEAQDWAELFGRAVERVVITPGPTVGHKVEPAAEVHLRCDLGAPAGALPAVARALVNPADNRQRFRSGLTYKLVLPVSHEREAARLETRECQACGDPITRKWFEFQSAPEHTFCGVGCSNKGKRRGWAREARQAA